MAFTVGCLCRPIKVAPLRNVDASEADNRLILSSSLRFRHSKRRTSIKTPNHSFPPVRDTGLKRSTVARSSRVVALIDGNPNQMAKQMERISAKEALILAVSAVSSATNQLVASASCRFSLSLHWHVDAPDTSCMVPQVFRRLAQIYNFYLLHPFFLILDRRCGRSGRFK